MKQAHDKLATAALDGIENDDMKLHIFFLLACISFVFTINSPSIGERERQQQMKQKLLNEKIEQVRKIKSIFNSFDSKNERLPPFL